MPRVPMSASRWMRAAFITSLGALTPAISPVATRATAQSTGHVVRGVVYDSVAGRPLAGATVQIAVPDSPKAPWTATTDSAGRYGVGDLPTGRVVIGFYHDALTMLGLDAPTRSVELSGSAEMVVDLAIPSSATIRALRCGDSPPYATGMAVGFVRDVAQRGAVEGTRVWVSWRAFALDSGDYRVVTERRAAMVEGDGAVLVCHLPTDVPLDLLVTAPGHRSIEGTVVTVPAAGVGRVDLWLTDSALTTGSAMIRGKVIRESGRAVASGQVVIGALNRTVPITDGTFIAANLPAGTWVAEARVMGVEPQDVLITASDSALATAQITVSNAPQRLDAVTVVGTMSRDLRVLDEVLRRKLAGMGTTFLPGHPALRSATFTSDVMKEARGFRWIRPDSIVGRDDCKNVAVYVDDVRQPDGFTLLDHSAPPAHVLAIETFSDIRYAPVQYRRFAPPPYAGPPGKKYGAPPPEPAPCALVLVWTKRRY